MGLRAFCCNSAFFRSRSAMASSEAFCSSADGIDKSSTASSANAFEGEKETAAMEASDVFKKVALSREVDLSLQCALSATLLCPAVVPGRVENAEAKLLENRATRPDAYSEEIRILTAIQ